MRKDICYLSLWVFVLFSSYTQNLRTFHNLCWEWEIVCNLPSIFCSWNHLSVHPPPLGPMFCGIHIVKKETRSKNLRDLEVYFLSFFFFLFSRKGLLTMGEKMIFPGSPRWFWLMTNEKPEHLGLSNASQGSWFSPSHHITLHLTLALAVPLREEAGSFST